MRPRPRSRLFHAGGPDTFAAADPPGAQQWAIFRTQWDRLCGLSGLGAAARGPPTEIEWGQNPAPDATILLPFARPPGCPDRSTSGLHGVGECTLCMLDEFHRGAGTRLVERRILARRKAGMADLKPRCRPILSGQSRRVSPRGPHGHETVALDPALIPDSVEAADHGDGHAQ